MSLESHISQLEQKHGSLEAQLDDLLASPSVSDEKLAEVKRQKLRLKDEISRLKSETA